MAAEATFQSCSTDDSPEMLHVLLNDPPKLPRCESGLVVAGEPRDAVFDSGRCPRAVRRQRHKGHRVFARSKCELQWKSIPTKHAGDCHFKTRLPDGIVKRLAALRIVEFETIEPIPKWKLTRGVERLRVTTLQMVAQLLAVALAALLRADEPDCTRRGCRPFPGPIVSSVAAPRQPNSDQPADCQHHYNKK